MATINDISRLSGVSKSTVSRYLNKGSVSKKTAEKIIIELRDKLSEGSEGSSLKEELDALEALKSLGYSQNEAREALKKVSTEGNTNTRIREALKILGGK